MLVALALALGLALAVSAGARAQAPVASFTYSPASPLTGQPVVFTSTSTGAITSLAWDLDGDGLCDDALGPVAARSFGSPGVHAIELCVNSGVTTQKQSVLVRNRAPRAYFSFSPGIPTVGELVTFASTSVDLDGPILQYGWELDDDGDFNDAASITASLAFGIPGFHRIGLRVVDRDGAVAVVYRPVVVAAVPLGLISPFPVVRLLASPIRRGARVLLLGVRAPPGVRVRIRCRGRSCPWHRKVVSPKDGRVRFRRLQRRLRAGTVIEVFVTQPGSVGKYTRFRIRGRRRAPVRVDDCVVPGAKRPRSCPVSRP
ncbi:MAG TPA: hypothetical protein VFQ12_10730 [Thermoleophilaceae bacterium]|nr:hypothetical protein [Thermoleophilaceae bacterium]